MAAQKCKNILLVETFCIFECLLAQNPTNQDSQLSWFFETIWKAISNSKNRELEISAWKWFKTLILKTFDAFCSFADLQSQAFLGKFTVEYCKSFDDKSNSLQLPILPFSSIWSWRSKSIDKIIFLVLS